VNRVLQIAAITALVLVAALAGEVGYTVHLLRPHLLVTLQNVDRTVIIAGGAATNLEKASRAWELQSSAQAKAVTRAMNQVSSAANELEQTAAIVAVDIDTTSKNINQRILPGLDQALNQQNTLLIGNQRRLQRDLDQLNQVLVDSSNRINDPNVAGTLAHLNETAANVSATTADLKAIADKAKEEYTKPVKLWWAVVRELIGIGGNLAQMIK